MSGHTPAPWKVAPTNGGDLAVCADRGRAEFPVATLPPFIKRPINDANARLIAAAPDLLKELQHLVRLLEPELEAGRLQVPGLATFNGAKAAIARASISHHEQGEVL